ncbi:unnamed protein product [Urochloa decumbens]|uniref:Uncharacterized protein n=1 Tax=Urochloa decumbens TaxID=240449 RepID=A0ABC8VZC4_9POAL
MQNKARRRRVPAFGEWNYYYYSGELATPTVAVAAAAASEPHWHAAAAAAAPAAELEASSDVWFKYSPPPRKPPPRPSATGRKKKARRPEKVMDRPYAGKPELRNRTARAAASSDGATPSSVESTPGSKGKAAAGAAGVRRVVRPPVDADLYQVPPPEFVPDDYDDEPRRWHKEVKRKKKASRSRWMGCFGFNCVPAE